MNNNFNLSNSFRNILKDSSIKLSENLNNKIFKNREEKKENEIYNEYEKYLFENYKNIEITKNVEKSIINKLLISLKTTKKLNSEKKIEKSKNELIFEKSKNIENLLEISNYPINACIKSLSIFFKFMIEIKKVLFQVENTNENNLFLDIFKNINKEMINVHEICLNVLKYFKNLDTYFSESYFWRIENEKMRKNFQNILNENFHNKNFFLEIKSFLENNSFNTLDLKNLELTKENLFLKNENKSLQKKLNEFNKIIQKNKENSFIFKNKKTNKENLFKKFKLKTTKFEENNIILKKQNTILKEILSNINIIDNENISKKIIKVLKNNKIPVKSCNKLIDKIENLKKIDKKRNSQDYINYNYIFYLLSFFNHIHDIYKNKEYNDMNFEKFYLKFLKLNKNFIDKKQKFFESEIFILKEKYFKRNYLFLDSLVKKYYFDLGSKTKIDEKTFEENINKNKKMDLIKIIYLQDKEKEKEL